MQVSIDGKRSLQTPAVSFVLSSIRVSWLFNHLNDPATRILTLIRACQYLFSLESDLYLDKVVAWLALEHDTMLEVGLTSTNWLQRGMNNASKTSGSLSAMHFTEMGMNKDEHTGHVTVDCRMFSFVGIPA